MDVPFLGPEFIDAVPQKIRHRPPELVAVLMECQNRVETLSVNFGVH